MTVLCRQCAHCKPRAMSSFHELGVHEWSDYTAARCALTDVVIGTGDAGRLCVDERANGSCGTDAKHFVRHGT